MLSRFHNVSSNPLVPFWIPHASVHVAEEQLVFSLRLMIGLYLYLSNVGVSACSHLILPFYRKLGVWKVLQPVFLGRDDQHRGLCGSVSPRTSSCNCGKLCRYFSSWCEFSSQIFLHYKRWVRQAHILLAVISLWLSIVSSQLNMNFFSQMFRWFQAYRRQVSVSAPDCWKCFRTSVGGVPVSAGQHFHGL